MGLQDLLQTEGREPGTDPLDAKRAIQQLLLLRQLQLARLGHYVLPSQRNAQPNSVSDDEVICRDLALIPDADVSNFFGCIRAPGPEKKGQKPTETDESSIWAPDEQAPPRPKRSASELSDQPEPKRSNGVQPETLCIRVSSQNQEMQPDASN